MAKLVEKYQDLFLPPKGLPLQRLFDHAIVPYRFTPQQKNETEKQVQEMLESGIIQHSSSPFSSPILLVKKKDVEKRLCVD